MTTDAQGPRIFVPPPFVFVGAWLAAWALSRRWPFEIDGAGASTVQSAIGAFLVASGLSLMAWAFLTFRRAGTPVVPIKPARVVVTDGPFHFTRNPMYLGLAGAYVGLAALLNEAWSIVLLPVALIVLSTWIIDREEHYLRSTFGAEYEAYCSRVRRWM